MRWVIESSPATLGYKLIIFGETNIIIATFVTDKYAMYETCVFNHIKILAYFVTHSQNISALRNAAI